MTVLSKKLSTGLTVIFHPTPQIKTVAINMMVKVGSRDENITNNGISHALEHMLFKGTTTRTAKMIAEEFDSIGGYINAYTSRENTSYHCKVMRENWKTGLEVLADICTNSTFPEDELAREKSVVIQEILENNDNPDDLINDLYQATAFPDQPLGRSILGDAETVSNFSREQLIGFMRIYYQPSNIVLAIAGDLDAEEVFAEAEKYFQNNSEFPIPTAPTARYEPGIMCRKDDFEQTHLIIGFEGMSYRDENYYTLHVLSTILGGSMSSRLFQEVREKRGLTYSISTNINAFDETGTFTINASTSEDKFREVIDVCFSELTKVMQDVSEEEIARSKAQLIAGLAMASENNNFLADEAAKCLLSHGRYITNEEVFDRINKVTRNELLELARKLFQGKLTFAATGKIENSNTIDFSQSILA